MLGLGSCGKRVFSTKKHEENGDRELYSGKLNPATFNKRCSRIENARGRIGKNTGTYDTVAFISLKL